MSREDEIMRGDRGPSGWKIALFVVAVWMAVGAGHLLAGTIGVAVVVAFCCGYLGARIEDEFRRKR